MKAIEPRLLCESRSELKAENIEGREGSEPALVAHRRTPSSAQR